MAAVEQRIAYQRELYAGDVITVGTGALEVCDRVIRFVHEMRNGTSGDVAAVTVLTGVYLDTAVRKASAFPQEVKERAIAHAVDFELPWAG